MKAAVVSAAGQRPAYGTFDEPTAAAGEAVVAVSAAALSPLTRGRAAGTHYSSTAGTGPFVPGVDGVGRLPDGRRVYFVLPRHPFGAMAERSVVAVSQTVPVPDDVDDVSAAAMANPGMSSWAALTERARLRPGETVLVHGATGTSGRLAVQIARHLGAARVVATGRNPTVLAEVGADATIRLGDDLAAVESAAAEQFAGRVDVVLDYLWGPTAQRLMLAAAKAGPAGVPVRFVQIGAASGGEVPLPAAILRSSGLVLIGSGIGSVSIDGLLAAIGHLFAAAGPAGFRVPTRPVPLADVAAAWASADDGSRVVFQPR